MKIPHVTTPTIFPWRKRDEQLGPLYWTMDYGESKATRGRRQRGVNKRTETDDLSSEGILSLSGWVAHRFASQRVTSNLEKVTNWGEAGGEGKHDARRFALPAGVEMVRSGKLTWIPALRSGLHAFGQGISAFNMPPGAF